MKKKIKLTDIDVRKAINDELARRGLSIPALARAVDIAERTVYSYLRGETSVRSDKLLTILDYLDFEVVRDNSDN